MSFNYARTERTFFDDELKGHFDRLEGMGPDKAEVSLVSKTRDEATWVVSFRRDDGPTEYSLYDTASHKLTPLFVSQPALSDYKFAPVWKSNFGRPTPSTRCCLRSCVCSTASRFHAIDATLSPWPRNLTHWLISTQVRTYGGRSHPS